jgi:hypothetical protein
LLQVWWTGDYVGEAEGQGAPESGEKAQVMKKLTLQMYILILDHAQEPKSVLGREGIKFIHDDILITLFSSPQSTEEIDENLMALEKALLNGFVKLQPKLRNNARFKKLLAKEGKEQQ